MKTRRQSINFVLSAALDRKRCVELEEAAVLADCNESLRIVGSLKNFVKS